MAQTATLLRFKIELSDIDRGNYTTLDFRIAQHPSETAVFLLTRIFAYCLNWSERLEFSAQGLADPAAPALKLNGDNGQIALWIEIGNPTAKKLHKASKAAKAVKVYTYKDPQVLLRELATQHVHRLETIQFFSLPFSFLEKLEKSLARDNKWGVVFMDQMLTVNLAGSTEGCELTEHRAQN